MKWFHSIYNVSIFYNDYKETTICFFNMTMRVMIMVVVCSMFMFSMGSKISSTSNFIIENNYHNIHHWW